MARSRSCLVTFAFAYCGMILPFVACRRHVTACLKGQGHGLPCRAPIVITRKFYAPAGVPVAGVPLPLSAGLPCPFSGNQCLGVLSPSAALILMRPFALGPTA